MLHVGYSVIDENNQEVMFWGNQTGYLVHIPKEIVLPNGDIVCKAEVGGSYSGYRVVERYIDDQRPSPFHSRTGELITFDGEKVVVSYTYTSEPDITPLTVTPSQFRRGLLQENLLDTVEAQIQNLPKESQIVWEYATVIERNHPMIGQLGLVLNKTKEEIDAFFRTASTL